MEVTRAISKQNYANTCHEAPAVKNDSDDARTPPDVVSKEDEASLVQFGREAVLEIVFVSGVVGWVCVCVCVCGGGDFGVLICAIRRLQNAKFSAASFPEIKPYRIFGNVRLGLRRSYVARCVLFISSGRIYASVLE